MKTKEVDNGMFSRIAPVIPASVIAESERICKRRGVSSDHINEIRLRAVGRSSIVLDGENFSLTTRVGSDELHGILKRICDMAIFAHRDDIANGFVSLSGGCRVGVCGHAKYDGGKLVGVNSVSSLVFRIPGGRCDFANELFGYWRERNFCGMLICSKAGIGKTSAIRTLAAMAGSAKWSKRVVVVDERCEFDPNEYSDCTVDILRGYKRAVGIEIAVRTMSAEILVVDEIGNDADSDALMLAIGAGVPVVATAHGDNISKVLLKPSIKRLIEGGLFESYAVIRKEKSVRKLELGEMSSIRNSDLDYTV